MHDSIPFLTQFKTEFTKLEEEAVARLEKMFIL